MENNLKDLDLQVENRNEWRRRIQMRSYILVHVGLDQGFGLIVVFFIEHNFLYLIQFDKILC